MSERHAHCGYCGTPFESASPWPRRCGRCGRSSYRNPLPVVVLLLPVGDGLVGVRRNIEPSRGRITLPGGYLDPGETWQEGARRELEEETGIVIPAGSIRLYDVANGLDDTIVIFGLAAPRPRRVLRPFCSAETQEVVLIEAPVELGFFNHTTVVARYFRERRGSGALSRG